MTEEGAQYLQRMLSGAEYIAYITSQESDRRVRSAFQDVVLSTAAPGAALFDFGAGPGIDARFFAERGFTVAAYDVDPRMRESFAEHCRDLIDSGRVRLDSSGYREFVTGRAADAGRSADLVISNFAPLNLVDDLPELFAKFAALTGPNGKVLASVLNPYFVGDMKLRWWWRSLGHLWRAGHFFMPGPQAPHHRRRLANFRDLGLPHFRLVRVFRGQPAAGPQRSNGIEFGSGGWYVWLRLLKSRYMFLLFEKQRP
jgi:SAM-dependent methyltransferase